jgi:hypothetical protein
MLNDQSGELPVAPGLVVRQSGGPIVVSVQAFEQVGVEYVERTQNLSLVVTTLDDSSQTTYPPSVYPQSVYGIVSDDDNRVVFSIPLEELPQAEQDSGTPGTNVFVFAVKDNSGRNSPHFIPKEMLLYSGSENAELADALDGEYFTGNGPAYTPVIVMGGYSGSYKNSEPVLDEDKKPVLQWNGENVGMSYNVVIEPRNIFSEPVIRYQWRAEGCKARPGMSPSVQPRAFIAREPIPGADCSDTTCREKRGGYKDTIPESEWKQFDWTGAFVDTVGDDDVPDGRAHLVATIVDDLKDCGVVQMRCIEVADKVADSGASSSDYHQAFWNDEDEQCEAIISR